MLLMVTTMVSELISCIALAVSLIYLHAHANPSAGHALVCSFLSRHDPLTVHPAELAMASHAQCTIRSESLVSFPGLYRCLKLAH